jgi:serine/threonine protein kinase
MQKDWTIDDFELGKPLGRGRFGEVWLAREKQSGLITAIKLIRKNKITETNCIKQIRREIEIHQHLKHENILRMYGYFVDSENIYLILEYAANGEFFSYLQREKRFVERKAAKYILEVANALKYMQQYNVIHRDLKPENLLFGGDGKLKVSDFGWAVKNMDKKRFTYCGTLEYLAPEMHNKNKHDFSLDMWCLGVLCYELLVGSTPFESKTSNRREMIEKLKAVSYAFPDHLSEDAKDFIASLLKSDATKRMKIDDVFIHRWILKNTIS